MKLIAEKTHEICSSIIEENDITPGLHYGAGGAILFLFEYYRLSKDDRVLKALQERINTLIENINQCQSYSISSGIAGVGWLLNYMYSKEGLSKDGENIIKEIDEYIIQNIENILADRDYDFMHGSLGVAQYLIDRNHIDHAIEVTLISLEDIFETNHGAYWIPNYWENEEEKKTINLSLAHGSASIVSLISNLIIKEMPNSRRDALTKLLDKTVEFMLYRRDVGIGHYYPSACVFNDKGELENKYSRLSWCYGDMGIGLSLWNAGRVFKSSDLKSRAVGIYKRTLSRQHPENEGIVDACVCHGTAGIAHMYNRMYYNTGDTSFRRAAKYWLEQTLEMSKFVGGAAGFKNWNGDRWEKKYGLLDGIAGVGLCMLSHDSFSSAEWDRCLLIS